MSEGAGLSPRSGGGASARRSSSGAYAASASPRTRGDGAGAGGASLTQFDTSAIDAMDPSVKGGWRVVYDRECPFELRYQETQSSPQEVGTIEAVKVKVLVTGPAGQCEALKIELSSESDLFFHYVHFVDEVGYRVVQEQQKLMVEFDDYAKVLTRMLNACIKEPNTHLAIMVMQYDDEGVARLDFIKNMEYKFVELLTCQFRRSEEELVRQHIAFRYNALKARLALMQGRLADVSAVVRAKNPSLLLQIQQKPPSQQQQQQQQQQPALPHRK
jgi:hypothetical protein